MDMNDAEHVTCLAQAQAAGAEVATEYLRLCNAEVDHIATEMMRRRGCLRADEPIMRRSHSSLLDQAKLRAQRMAQFQVTPDAQFLDALSHATQKLAIAVGLLESARAARSRGFPAEAEHAHNSCDDAAAAAQEAALHLQAAATIAEQIRVKAYEASR